MQYVTVIKLGSTNTGLTLKAKLFDTANAQVGSDITTGFTALAVGEYAWVATIPDDFTGTIRIYSGATYYTSTAVGPSKLSAVLEVLQSRTL